VVRNIKTLDELIESARGFVMSPEEFRAQRCSLVYSNTGNANHHIIARVGADFERIFWLGTSWRVRGIRAL